MSVSENNQLDLARRRRHDLSQGILVATLFVVGWAWAGYAGAPRLLTGLAIMAIGIGIGMVGIAVVLGG